MNNAPEYKFREVQENVHYHFNFLLDRGFRIVSIIFVDKDMERWAVIMVSNECLIKLYNHRDEIRLGISTLQLYHQMGFFDLEELMLPVRRGEEPPARCRGDMLEEEQQFERLAGMLKDYIDNIIFLPGENLYSDGKELYKALLQIRSTISNKNKRDKVWFYYQDLLNQS